MQYQDVVNQRNGYRDETVKAHIRLENKQTNIYEANRDMSKQTGGAGEKQSLRFSLATVYEARRLHG